VLVDVIVSTVPANPIATASAINVAVTTILEPVFVYTVILVGAVPRLKSTVPLDVVAVPINVEPFQNERFAIVDDTQVTRYSPGSKVIVAP
jgi:hypothetical protein